jgi:hypothetical protein
MTPMDADQTIKEIELIPSSSFLISFHLCPSASSAEGFSSLSFSSRSGLGVLGGLAVYSSSAPGTTFTTARDSPTIGA